MKTFGRKDDTKITTNSKEASRTSPTAKREPSSTINSAITSAAATKAKDDLRTAVFKDLLDAMNLTELAAMEASKARIEVGEVVSALLIQQNTNLSLEEQEVIAYEIVNDVLGLGPLEQLLARDDIADIMVCGPNKVFIEVNGRLQLTDIKFRDEAQLINICRKIVSAVGRRVDESSPICDARLMDGSRVAIVAPPISVDGTSLTIRKFKKEKLGLNDLVKFGSISKSGARILEIASSCRCNILVSGGTGSGKALSINAKLASPTGWRRMGDIKINDILLAPDGKITKVTGVYPQGELEMFSVVFEDGRTVPCCDNHLWKAWFPTVQWCPIKQKMITHMQWNTVSLKEIRKWFDQDQNNLQSISIPLVTPFAMEFVPQLLKIDPYELGVLLSSPKIYKGSTNSEFDMFETISNQNLNSKIFQQSDDILLDDIVCVNSLESYLVELGLSGIKSDQMFVPLEYKTSSVQQRIDLLRGLMDTSGYIKNNSIMFDTNSENLALDVQQIAWSLGAIASVTSEQKDCFETNDSVYSYRLTIKHPDLNSFFTQKTENDFIVDHTSFKLKIKEIKSIGKHHAQCISVDHPDKLYVTDGWIVTHNTTLLNCLTRSIDPGEAIITCEDACELQLQQGNVRRWETRPPNLEGAGEITMSALVKAALRHRPERIIIGEVRGKEAFDLLQAMNTGHDGSAGTVHSNSPREAIGRVESMIAMGGFTLPAKTVREMIVSSIDLIVQATRLRDGSRKITHITEVVGLEGDTVTLQDLVLYEQTGEDANGRILGRHKSTGMRPHFYEKARGYSMDKDLMTAMQEMT